MKNFQQHIQSVQNLEVFAEYEKFLSFDDKKNVDDKCFELNKFLSTNQEDLDINHLKGKRLEFEKFVASMLKSLKQRHGAIGAGKQQQANKETKLTGDRDNLIKYLDSIRQMCESEQIAGTEYKDTLKALYNETQEWLQSEEISAESIQTKHEELQVTVQEIKQSMSQMKQKNEAEESLRQKAFDNMCNYIDEVQTKIATDEENDEFTRPHINRITESCEIVLEWVKKNYDRITSDTIISEQRNLRTTIEDIYDKMQASKIEAEEIFRQQALTAVHDYIDDVRKSLEAERETDKTIVQCIDTIYKHCTNVFKWTNENYHQITGGRILSEFDNLQKNVNDIFNVLQARKIEVEAERERQRAETIRKRADVINNLRAYISDVKSLVVFENFKNRFAEEDLRLIFGQCDIAERHIKENSDTNQLEVQYSDLRKLTEHVYKKLEQIDALEKAELAKRQAEERRKKSELSQKLKSYIDRARRLIVFEPLTHRLTKSDKAKIHSECIKADHFLLAENLTSFESERKRKELEELVQNIYKKLKTREEIANKCKDDLVEWNKAEGDLCNRINYWKQFVTRNRRKDKLTDKYLNRIVEICTDAEQWLLVSYQKISRNELIDKRFSLETDACNIWKSLQDEKQNDDFGRSPDTRYFSHPEDSITALLKFARLARRKIHSHVYKTQIPDSDRNKIISKYNEVIERVWTKERAEIELMEFKQLCIKVFKAVDEKADPQRIDIERRWYY
uniref:myosin heavy chain, striated muscle-like n=1 Tax=Styela clava TaxID=7725 RepID=UPI00193A24DA|nr:myosin heavy chain, striated muscle-like [Styela clava]